MSTPTKPAKPVTNVKGTNTTADPNNCQGSGKTWETGGKCPECGNTANQLQELYSVTARRGDTLTPRVPKHPKEGTVTDARTAADAAVLNGTTTTDKVPGQGPASVPEKPRPAKRTSARSVPSTPPAKPGKTKAASGSPKAVAAPAKPVKERKVKDPLTAPFTPAITQYLPWFKAQLAANNINFDKMPRDRLAGLAITMYGRFQVSPERRATRNGS